MQKDGASVGVFASYGRFDLIWPLCEQKKMVVAWWSVLSELQNYTKSIRNIFNSRC